MSVFCETLLALGITAGWICAAPPEKADVFGGGDDDVFGYIRPDSSVETPPLAMPPVIIEKDKVVEVERVKPKPKDKVVVKEPFVDQIAREQFLESLWRRRQLASSFSQVTVNNSVPPSLTLSAPATDFSFGGDLGSGPGSALQGGYPFDEKYLWPERLSGFPVDNKRILASDRYIAAVFETGVNSQVGSNQVGSIVLQTTRHVYGYHGRSILVPKGSRLLCGYVAPEKVNQTRMDIKCNRIIMAGYRAEIIGINAAVGDQHGRVGVSGKVDRRWWEQYGSAILLSVVSATVVGASQGFTDAVDSSAIQAGAEDLAQKFGQITASILQKTIDLRPVITIAQGTRVIIKLEGDWYIKPVG